MEGSGRSLIADLPQEFFFAFQDYITNCILFRGVQSAGLKERRLELYDPNENVKKET